VFECKPEGLFKLPAGMSAEAGALVEPLAVAVHAVRLADIPSGASVAVVGAGTIGLMTLIAARALGVGRIDVLARHDHQAALAAACGATTVYRNPPESLEADYVFETVGATPRVSNSPGSSHAVWARSSRWAHSSDDNLSTYGRRWRGS
jgi:threonine dehydrogenase-like Zn-dependent dehydrogenase